jgi:hypothetical protein
MRFWFIVFLAILMPLQLSWAAAGRYCQHEVDGASKHVGHHTHQHQVAERAEAGDNLAKKISVDLDCGTCHAGCSMASNEPYTVENVSLNLTFASRSVVKLIPASQDRPERPQWYALV